MTIAWRSLIVFVTGVAMSCGSSGPDLDDFLPAVPAPDGSTRTTFAGVAATEADLVDGPARTGVPGDVYLRNDKAHFVVQAASRVIGIIPWGGNVVDGALLGGEDQMGEVSLVYQLGRTCAHDRVEVLRDGSGGGPAVVRAFGHGAPNDGINLKGIGAIPVPTAVDADIEDDVSCATTYTLRPGATHLEVAWTIFNPKDEELAGPLGVLSDVGGEIQVFTPRQGFQSIGGSLGDILEAEDVSTPYMVYQAPGAAWAVIPRLAPGEESAGFIVAGASFLVFGIDQFLQVIAADRFALHVPPKKGVTATVDVALGRDAAAIEAELRRGEALVEVTGTLPFPDGRARLTFFHDAEGNGVLDATDRPLFYLDADEAGALSGRIPAGSYLVRAEVPELSRSAVASFTASGASATLPALELPAPARLHFTIRDAAHPDGLPIPAKLLLVGTSPVPPDSRVAATNERPAGTVRIVHAAHGTSNPAGSDRGDPPLLVPAGGPYRLFVSRGPEWSINFVDLPTVTPGEERDLAPIPLERVVDTSGYVATAFHEHAVGSPDSAVPWEARVASLAVEGIELFAGTEHDNLVDYAPVVAAMGLGDVIRPVIGVETTPFVYGHFIGFPLERDPSHPAGGAVDWAAGTSPFAMLPAQIFGGLRAIGARVVQVCHPRGDQPGFGTFQSYFDRAGLTFDFVARTATGVAIEQEVPSDWLRLPTDEVLYSDDFDALEVWNNHSLKDVDGDGTGDYFYFERVMKDWMNYLSLGRLIAPVGNGDTHGGVSDAAGLPRTLVRVGDDTISGLAAGGDEEVWDALAGDLPRDVVLTNGPMIRITSDGAPAIGKVVAGATPLVIEITSADWVDFDTVEIYANATFDTPRDPLVPIRCYTNRASVDPADPCAKPGTPLSLEVELVPTPHGSQRRQAVVNLALTAADIPTRAGKTGDDAWLVVRVRGSRSLFPVIFGGVLEGQGLTDLTSGSPPWNDALVGKGSPATAMSGAVLLDFDGGGWRAPFQP